MISHLRRLFDYRGLLWMWTWREIRSRYRQSLLGGLWAILQPLVVMLVFNVIFARFLRVPTDGIPYPVFSYSALLFWTFFSTSVSFGTNSLVNNAALLRKIYFPREILPMAAVGASFVDLVIASSVFAGLMVYYRTAPSLTMLWVIPLLVLQVLLTLGVILFSSALNAFYRDLRFVVPLGLQLWMYATPVIYPVSIVPERWRPFLALNPMLGIVEGYRASLLNGQGPDWPTILPGAIVALALFLGGYLFFKRVEGRLADVI
jgi:lipopolysaccharide transport system permease protein